MADGEGRGQTLKTCFKKLVPLHIARLVFYSKRKVGPVSKVCASFKLVPLGGDGGEGGVWTDFKDMFQETFSLAHRSAFVLLTIMYELLLLPETGATPRTP